ncbi:MAG: glycosyltransferase family 4 protein [Alphaproteobacteria bacterium]|nr:glycosyltransferase family 4 protein [Alphaproteobacteria bacterium]
MILKHIQIKEIHLNNIAGYIDYLQTFNRLKKLKQATGAKIIFKAHDYQFICPSINMIKNNLKYCASQGKKFCKECFQNEECKCLLKCNNIEDWQTLYENFLVKICNQIIVFSNSTKKICLKFYPQTKEKIVVIPHKTKKLPTILIEKHPEINIGFIGALTPIKGKKLIQEFSKLIPDEQNINLHFFGTNQLQEFKKSIFHGKYDINDLPNLLSVNKIDIIFIASIIPETFSYTTAEAMSMGIPVACFNIGAPAERIKNYERGLIISKIDPQVAFNEIINFIKK